MVTEMVINGVTGITMSDFLLFHGAKSIGSVVGHRETTLYFKHDIQFTC